jgi:glycosyltransferase involved in cell wall biosynthesis
MSPFAKPLQGRLLGFLSDIIISVSQATKNYIISINPFLEKKVKLVYNGVDLAVIDATPVADIHCEMGIPASAPLIGAVGRIERTKGYDALIAAAETIKKTLPSLRVLIIGSVFVDQDQVYMDELLKKVKDKRLGSNIIFTGFRSDAIAVIKALDIFVHQALCPDAFPGVVLEAAALKKTIVATRVGGIPEILQDGVSGILVEAGNADALAAAVISLLANPEAANRLGMAARKKVASCFDLKKHLAEVTAIYESLWKKY